VPYGFQLVPYRSQQIEIRRLQAQLDDCVRGRGGAALLIGAAGCGKTTLLQSLADRAARAGATILTSSGSDATRATPLGVVRQLLAGAALPPATTGRVTELLENGSLAARLHPPDDETVQHIPVPVLRELHDVLKSMAAAPLLILVDDVHLADVPSLQVLLYVVRRSVRNRILVVAAETTQTRSRRPLLRGELLSQPHCLQLRLDMLSLEDVAGALRERLGDQTARDLAADLHGLSGGNPLLLSALLEDRRRTTRPPAGLGGSAEAFRRAVVDCLNRSDPLVLRVVRAVAVLGEPASPAQLGRLLGLDGSAVHQALAAAAATGLLDRYRFRHPRAAAAILQAMQPKELAALHVQAAELLHSTGSPALTVARHKIVADRATSLWSTALLCEAAETALDQGGTGLALDCLRLAERSARDPAERMTIKSMLLRAHVRVDPAAADRHATELLTAATAGKVHIGQSLSLIRYLLWYRPVEETVALLDRIQDTPEAGTAHIASALRDIRAQIAYFYPARAAFPAIPAAPDGLATDDLCDLDAYMIDSVIHHGLTEDTVSAAERILQQARLTDATSTAILIALQTLTLADRLDAAAFWCDWALRAAGARSAPTWSALFSGVRAMISYRQGDLDAAERNARAALSLIPPKSLGVFIGAPLSVLLLVATATGDQRQAMACLDVAVPEAMFSTPYALHYLTARARYHLTGGRYEAATADFARCRHLLARSVAGGTSVPAGNRTAASSIAAAILRQALGVPAERVPVARSAQGSPAGGGVVGGTGPVTAHRSTGSAPDNQHSVVPVSDAELRVARLAAAGHTNREIARSLYVTVSTVEQHLTHVYRKLRVSRRTDLQHALLQLSA
jgi:DNA-binding CsgD family transcriptional regulator/tetratricopeptide (TPR) repeat protein